MNFTSDGPNAPRTWVAKFRDAFRGVRFSVVGSSSFYVHIGMAVLVFILATWLRVERVDWCLLILCVAIVMAAEAFNSALESLARAVDSHHNPSIGRALDSASGGVLLVSIGAAAVGAIVFLQRLLELLA